MPKLYSELNDHELMLMLHVLKKKLDESFVKNYKARVQHLGEDCPYAAKARKAFVKMHKDEILLLVDQIYHSAYLT